MSIQLHVLGDAGRDNAVLIYIHSGQTVERLLFDCGEGCLRGLPFAEIQRIDHLFFSHLHMDHVGGFDSFFRCVYNRDSKENAIWGPVGTARIIHHRFQGFLWNLHAGQEAQWRVYDVEPGRVAGERFSLAEAFTVAHEEETRENDGLLLQTPTYSVEAVQLDHLTPSLGYIVRESPRRNIDTGRLAELGLTPGPWLQELKSPTPPDEVTIDGTSYPLADLRAQLLGEKPGDAVAYLTDFRLDEPTLQTLAPRLRGCRLVCESAYREADAELARQNYHLTATGAATLAREAQAHSLVLIHISDRYPLDEYPQILAEARAVFPRTGFPRGWGVE